MDNDIKTWLYDILQSINEIDGYFENKPKVFEEYVSDIKTRRAIIGAPGAADSLPVPGFIMILPIMHWSLK